MRAARGAFGSTDDAFGLRGFILFLTGFFGMNFEHIPWLHESWGLSATAVLMVISAVAPFLYFKRRRWL